MSMEGTKSSSQRPIPLKIRPDLHVKSIDYLGVSYMVIKDPVGLQYHRLQEEQYHALELLNGERSLEQVKDDLRDAYPTLHLTMSDVQQLITDLHKKGLVQSLRSGQAGSLVLERRKTKREKLFGQLKSLLYLRLPGWDPEATLTAMYPFTRWIYNPIVVWLCMLFVASSWVLLLVNFDAFRSKLPEFQSFFGWPNLMYIWVVLGGAKIIHEFGHGLSCKHYRGECHEMGVMLLVFSPCLYCDVTDSWMLRSKWQRIIIAAAGMYIEVILSAIAIYVWWYTRPGLLHHLALNLFFVTTITTVIFNANPLMRFDGYYMMSDFLEIPNLRAKSDKLLRENFAWYCLGIEPQPDPFMPETGKAWFIAYAIAAWLYRWVILFSISYFLYSVLKPYDLQSLGIVLAFVSMFGIFFSMIKNTYQTITAPRIDPLSKPKIAITLLIVGAVTAAILAIPIEWHVEAPLLLEPHNALKITTKTPGRLLTPDDVRRIYNSHEENEFSIAKSIHPDEFTIRVKAGDHVEAQQILAVIENIDKSLEEHDLEHQLLLTEKLEKEYENLKDYVEQNNARQKIRNLNKQLESVRKELQLGIIRADIAGIVVPPQAKPEPKFDDVTRIELGSWYGTPLDDRNKNCHLDLGTHLLSIAPNSEIQANLYVDQGDTAHVKPGAEATIKFDHLPAETYEAVVENTSMQGEVYAPETLTTKYGGQIGTTTDQDGRERFVSTAFKATVVFKEDVDLFKNGARGWARFVVDERTIGQWGWLYFRKTFHFRM